MFDAAAAPPDLLHRQEAARSLVDVPDSICADSVLVHQPAKLDEQPVRVGVLLLKAVQLLHALGGFLVAQAHDTQELLDPSLAWTGVDSPYFEPLEHRAGPAGRCSLAGGPLRPTDRAMATRSARTSSSEQKMPRMMPD